MIALRALPVLRAIPAWAWVLAALLAWGGWQRHQAHAAAAALQHQTEEAAAARVRAAEAAATETARRVTAQKGITDDAQTALDAARRSAGSVAANAARLRAQLAAARRSTADPLVAADCSSATARADVLADLLSSAADRAASLAAEADASRIAGSACERSYDALTTK